MNSWPRNAHEAARQSPLPSWGRPWGNPGGSPPFWMAPRGSPEHIPARCQCLAMSRHVPSVEMVSEVSSVTTVVGDSPRPHYQPFANKPFSTCQDPKSNPHAAAAPSLLARMTHPRTHSSSPMGTTAEWLWRGWQNPSDQHQLMSHAGSAVFAELSTTLSERQSVGSANTAGAAPHPPHGSSSTPQLLIHPVLECSESGSAQATQRGIACPLH